MVSSAKQGSPRLATVTLLIEGSSVRVRARRTEDWHSFVSFYDASGSWNHGTSGREGRRERAVTLLRHRSPPSMTPRPIDVRAMLAHLTTGKRRLVVTSPCTRGMLGKSGGEVRAVHDIQSLR
ncbi:hypothetical protein BDZ90DRAFT_105280 [Jaminaea rosea]|uniref:Uncharacterized protein n=1 Tax=Jaminaea rosea TaxID=1569628 RepID=A0A316UWZ2_9BASI|nr:hypothetical protein BDZ90DRAFT_105280 [Jaminaea rosea]PWN29308.1 hypothetical protein BDZ90DRAFT_105280 [Jaminaea rosea]